MHTTLRNLLACPKDGAFPLRLHEDVRTGDRITAGHLQCPHCRSSFPISSGVALFLKIDNEMADAQRQEMKARDWGYGQRTRFDLEWQRMPEFDAIRSAVGDCEDKCVLDAGCGFGPMTSTVKKAARVVGIDFSLQGLLHFQFPDPDRVDLIQGDVCRMPLRDNVFDLVISSQVIEHLPSRELRLKFIAETARLLKPGGYFVITVYNAARREAGEPKEGFHESGIFYHMYDVEEFREDLSRSLRVERMQGVQVYLPRTYRFVHTLKRYSVYWDRLWRSRRIALSHSRLLLAAGRRPE